MKVLIINAYFQPEQIAFTHLEKDLLDAFVNEGIQIEVITPIPTRGIDGETRQQYGKRKREDLYDGAVKVHRFWAPKEGKKPLLRAFRYFWCNLREYQIGKKFSDIDVIFAPSTPPTQGWMAGKVKKSIQRTGRKSIRFVYNLQDVFPDSLVNAGMTRKGSIIWRIGRTIENGTYKDADKVITISEAFKKNLMDKGITSEKVVVIPNWIDTSEVFDVPRSENKIIKKYGLNPDKFYVCYSGNIGHSQNLELLVDAADELRKVNEQIEFVIIGDGASKDLLKQMVEAKNISNVHLLPYQPYDDIAHVFSLGDADLVISKKGTGGSSVPSKTWSIMAAGRPILASFDADSELVNLISKTQSGVFADADDVNGFVDAVVQLYGNESGRRKMGNNGREYVRENLSKMMCTQKYIDTFLATVKR